MTIYIDEMNHVYRETGRGRKPVETHVFDNMDISVAECYCYYPADGKRHELVQAWATSDQIDKATAIAEARSLVSQNDELLDAMAAMVEDVYNQDIEAMEA